MNSEIERFDISEAAEQLEAMTAEVEVDKGNVIDLIRKLETRVSQGGELGLYKPDKERSGFQPHHGSPLPLRPTSIKLESGCISEP